MLGWLFGFYGPLRRYFSLYRAVSQRREKIEESKNVQTTPAPTASPIYPYPTIIQIVGRPGTGTLPRTIALPDHLLNAEVSGSFALAIIDKKACVLELYRFKYDKNGKAKKKIIIIIVNVILTWYYRFHKTSR